MLLGNLDEDRNFDDRRPTMMKQKGGRRGTKTWRVLGDWGMSDDVSQTTRRKSIRTRF
jgi:hypothetical protein